MVPINLNMHRCVSTTLPEGWTLEPVRWNRAQYREVEVFYREHYVVASGHRTPLTLTEWRRFRDLRGDGLLLREGSTLRGAIFSIPLPIAGLTQATFEPRNKLAKWIGVDETVALIACTTYLCLATAQRKQGLAPILITAFVERCRHRGIMGSYQVGSIPRSPLTLAIQGWYHVLTDRASLGGFQGSLTTRPGSVTVRRTTDPESYSKYLALSASYPIAYRPSLDHWKRWIDVYPTYEVMGSESALFTLHPVEMVTTRGSLTLLRLVLAVGAAIPALHGAVLAERGDVLVGSITGPITRDAVIAVGGHLVATRSWCDVDIVTRPVAVTSLHPGDLLLPLF